MSKYPDNLHEHVPLDPTSESAKPDALVSAIHGWLGWIANRARPWTKEDEDSLSDLLQRAEEALAALQYISEQGQWIEETGRLKAENEKAKQELAAYIADGLPEYQRLGKELRDRMEAAQSQAAAMAGLLEDLLPYAEACIGSTWIRNPPSDSVITAAKSALAAWKGKK
jgi:hypothetical protein